ncbi:MAG: GNAT family N-acetyltransferase [Anaerolineales bacterium]
MKSAGVNQPTLSVVPATPEHWPDVKEFFANIPCTCQYWRQTSREYGRASKDESIQTWQRKRQAALRSQLAGATPPGVLAYQDGQLVGWCGFGPREQMGRLVRSRTIPKVDHLPVWSIVCFTVKVGFRRQGVTKALLQGAIDCARAYGAPALEAYPVDPGGRGISGTFAYVGLASIFERAGFQHVVETHAHSAGLPRQLMRLKLA